MREQNRDRRAGKEKDMITGPTLAHGLAALQEELYAEIRNLCSRQARCIVCFLDREVSNVRTGAS